MPPNPNDPDVIALSKAIFQHESGGDFNAVGDAGTSHGAGQWQPDTWKGQAQDVLGDANAPMTPDNQKAVIMGSIAKDKAAGLNPAQIAAKWNSGQPDGWENKIGVATINGQRVPYNVPKYVKDVTDLYHQYKGQTVSQGNQGYNPQPFSNPANPGQFDFTGTQAPETPQDNSLAGKLHGRLEDAAGALTQAAAGQINPFSGVLQAAGAGAGAIGDTVNAGFELIPGVKQGEELLGKGVGKLAQTDTGQAVVKGVSDFSQAHPELSKDIGAAGNIASVIPVVKGAGMLKDAAGAGLKDALVGSSDAVYDAVSPELGPKALAKEIAARGTSQKGWLKRTVLNTNSSWENISDAVKKEVPGFNPGAPIPEQIRHVQEALDASVEQLKNDVIASGSDRIFSPNELKGVLNGIEVPISLHKTPFESQVRLLKDAFVKISEEQGGKVSSLLPALQEFDKLITRDYGESFWTREAAPMRQAVREMRNAVSKFAEERLPDGIGFRERRLNQSRLIRAIENMSKKAALKKNNEIGTNVISRLAKRHKGASGILKMIARGAAEGVGAGEVIKHF